MSTSIHAALIKTNLFKFGLTLCRQFSRSLKILKALLCGSSINSACKALSKSSFVSPSNNSMRRSATRK